MAPKKEAEEVNEDSHTPSPSEIAAARNMLVRNVKDGYGWIDPEMAADLLADALGIDPADPIIDEILMDLYEMDLLYYPSENNPEERGEKVEYGGEIEIKDLAPSRAPSDDGPRPTGAVDGINIYESMNSHEDVIKTLKEAQSQLEEAAYSISVAMRKLRSMPEAGNIPERIRTYILGHLEPMINSNTEWLGKQVSLEDIIEEIQENFESYEEEEEDED
jgi:hypothetical protein